MTAGGGRHRARASVAEVVRLRGENADLRQQLAAERYAARHDPLTGLVNRRGLYGHAAALCGPPARPVAAMMLDLDGFKQINDMYGHGVGDQALATVAARLVACVGDGWVVARWGGDELAAVFAGCPIGSAWLEGTVRRLRRVLSSPMRAGRHKLHVTVAIGAVTATTPVALEDLLARADAAMYRVKDTNRQSPDADGTAVSPVAAARVPAPRAVAAVAGRR